MRLSDFKHFCQEIANADLGLSEVQKAVALLWHEDHYSPDLEMSAVDLAEVMRMKGLAGRINVPRLVRNLSKSKYTIKGYGKGTFRIALAHKPALDELYLPLLKHPKVKVVDKLLPSAAVAGTRPLLEKLAWEINGCDQYGFYDGCAALCRRMVESLLIEAFDRAGHLAAIQDGQGKNVGLDLIIAKANSGQFIKLGKTTPRNLDLIKAIGDTASHDRYHITTEHDISEFRVGFRKVISELLALAGIIPNSPSGH